MILMNKPKSYKDKQFYALRQSQALLQRLFSLKSLLIMKLVLILLVITGLQVTARPSEAQNVTLSEHNISLKKVFKKIRKQTGYQFFYNDELLKTSRPVDIHVENTSLKEVLEDCFKDQPLSYGMVGKVIVVKESVKGKATGSRIKIEQIQ